MAIDPKTEKVLRLRLDRARLWLLGYGDGDPSRAYWGMLTTGLEDAISDVAPDGSPVGTAGTDGRRIYWSPAYLARISDAELRWLLAHEAGHPALGHLWRLSNDEDGNVAGDYELDEMLGTIAGLNKPAGLLDCPLELRGKTLEEKYQAVKARHQQPKTAEAAAESGKPGKGDDAAGTMPGRFFAPAPDADANPVDPDTERQRWEQLAEQAAQAVALTAGTMPAPFAERLARRRVISPDWRVEMAEFCRTQLATRNDWTRASNRHAWQSVIYPRRRVDELSTVVFIRDFSGSVSADVAAEFTEHISLCTAETQCRAHVADVDTQVHATYNLEPGDEVPALRSCHGGTDFVCLDAHVDMLRERGDALAGVVILTDGEVYGWPELADVPVLVVCTTERIAPIGRTIKITTATGGR